VKDAGEEKMFYLPTIVLVMLVFFALLVLLFALIMVGTISYAFEKVGLDAGPVVSGGRAVAADGRLRLQGFRGRQ
jgi:uncharacterized membrane protein